MARRVEGGLTNAPLPRLLLSEPPFDDRRQERIRLEAEAVEAILARIERGEWHLVGSHALAFEISRTPDPLRRRACLAMLAEAREIVETSEALRAETSRLIGLGLRPLDAAHLASAQAGRAEIFLTVDDALLRAARRIGQNLPIRVETPVAFLLGAPEGETP